MNKPKTFALCPALKLLYDAPSQNPIKNFVTTTKFFSSKQGISTLIITASLIEPKLAPQWPFPHVVAFPVLYLVLCAPQPQELRENIRYAYPATKTHTKRIRSEGGPDRCGPIGCIGAPDGTAGIAKYCFCGRAGV
ncbi:uncharacterized protein EAE98_009608 [Botrytis deweyae]|uniref:Invertebrate defensins family profile domain-containing protein n=1 Tax=Botrytis deweyae TaxID=2478750 RepID=A0ABQ7IB63_9HELO|nr:uncharacterized protein EAE98_009608 [Botrytis deweyae]KAF7918830.1 hypothetical protein EAE98_009608 [Botrytis deweyae]